MAEEKEGIQKPKAELIKKTPGESGPPEAAKPVQEREERRKVVVVKKKPIPLNRRSQPKAAVPRGAPGEKSSGEAPVGAASRDAPVEKPAGESPRVTAGPDAGQLAGQIAAQIAAAAAGQSGQPPASEGGPASGSVPPPEANAGAAPGTPAEDAAPADAASETPAPKPFTLNQRPAVAAGRVGGRFVGPRPPREAPRSGPPPSTGYPPSSSPGGYTGGAPGGYQGRSSAPYTPRPQGMGGRVGGRPMGARPDGRPGPGGPRPGGYGPRPGGPGGPGGPRPGYGARPGGPVRPGMGRPGTSSAPPPAADGKGPAKKSFKAKKPAYTRKDKELEMEAKLLQTKKKTSQNANPVPKSIDIMEVVTVSDLARKMNLKASDLIHKLMSMGQMVTINQQIDADTASILAAEFGADVRIISLYDETVIETASDEGAEMAPRPPVVTVMGHVDHGKTKLLDAIRSTDVVAGEFGGITQHIGAYTVETGNGRITFLDTPGHEAFTRMRARGAQVTDIVVLVVAADDGVMPQTVEAINHAKDAGVPIIVALNKIDKPEANPDKVKSQLSDLGLVPEEWGGQTMFAEVSALRKEGLDKLIEAILLEAEILDLTVNYNRAAEGKILESRIDHGRGIVATVMVERGTLRTGDSFVAGVWPGKVRALFTDKGEKVDEATPSMPIEVLGFEGIPNAGDPLQVVEDEKTARGISTKRQELKRFEDAKNVKKITLDNLYDTISDGEVQELKVIIKADVQGSAEALRSSLEKLSTKEVRLNVIQALPGAINEGDVDLAIASNAIIIGFNVRPVPKAKILADQEKVDIRRYNVIYKAMEEIQQAMEGMLKPETREETIATVEVRETFKTPKAGVIAGCYVLTGTVKRSAQVNVIRDNVVVHTGKIGSLRRFKDDVREVAANFECGLGIEGYDGVQVGDQLEVFEIVEVARKLSQ